MLVARSGRRVAAGSPKSSRTYSRAAARAVAAAQLLPALGIVGLICLWWALVAGFDVKPFIAPSPLLVVADDDRQVADPAGRT